MNITLRPWNINDAALYARMISRVDFSYEDEEIRCKDAMEASRTLDWMLHQEDYNGDFYRAILIDGEVVGNVQVVRQGGVSCGDGHIGCMLVKEAVGRGIGTEAVRQMVEMAFTRRNYNRLTAIVYSPNKASMRLVEKLEFTLEATMHNAVWKHGYFYNALVYGLLREETGIATTNCCEPEDDSHLKSRPH